MLTLYKIALAPALYLQGSRLRRTALRLPEARGPRTGAAVPPGSARRPALRLLFIGDSSVAGVGVSEHREAMPWQAANLVSERLRRPVEWQIVARSGIDTREALALVRSSGLGPADLVVTSLGTNDVTSQASPRRYIAAYDALTRYVHRRTGARGHIITGLPPLHRLPAAPQPLRWYLGRYAKRLDNALQRYCASLPNARFVSLGWAKPEEMARDQFHPGQSQHRYWAALVAAEAIGLAIQEGPA